MNKSGSSRHIIDRANSRGYDISFDLGIAPCEFCMMRRLECTDQKHYTAEQVHHIETSYRGKRKHNKDGTDILGVCHTCHDYIHNTLGNNQDTKEQSRILAKAYIEFGVEAIDSGKHPSNYAREKSRILLLQLRKIKLQCI